MTAQFFLQTSAFSPFVEHCRFIKHSFKLHCLCIPHLPLLSSHCFPPQSVSEDQLPDCQDFFFLANFQDLLSPFSPSLQFSLCHLNIYQQIPAQRKKEKKTTFLAFSRQWLSKNLHWHTGVNCIVSPMQTRCEALMYGSIFFSSKEDKCRPKM